MSEDLRVPPISPDSLSPPDEIAERLAILVGYRFPLTGKTRTDGSKARRLVEKILCQNPLPEPCPPDLYTIVPPKRKGVPRILREYIDTYIVTSGRSYNLQVWNRNPASNSIQVEYNFHPPLVARDVRFVFIRVDPLDQHIRAILILSPEYIETEFGSFGKPTIKHQLIIASKTREIILDTEPPILFYSDSPRIASLSTDTYRRPLDSIGASPKLGDVFSLEVLRDRLKGIIGIRLDEAATKNRGQALEMLVAGRLGYEVRRDEFLSGTYPDIQHQILEVKVQDSPTVDLGQFSPQFKEGVPNCLGATTLDVRYLIVLSDPSDGVARGMVLCPGERLGEHFAYVSDKSFKCQRSIPMKFFEKFRGRALFNP